MAPRLRRLSGRDVVRILEGYGFVVVHTRGSHAKLRRERPGAHQVMTIPLHRELAPGTLQAIYRQASRVIPDAALREQFYSS